MGGLIPQRKLEGAMKTYPIPGDGVVIALFDTTLLGSAEDGMIIGERGISWHNSTMGFRLTAMSWDTFSTKEIKHNDNDIIIGEGNKFDMGGTIIENDKAVELLTDIQLQIKKINTNSVEFKKFTNDKIEKNIFPGSIKYLTKELIPNQLAVGKAYRFTGEIVAVNDSSEDEIVIKLCNFKHEMEIDVHVSFVFDNLSKQLEQGDIVDLAGILESNDGNPYLTVESSDVCIEKTKQLPVRENRPALKDNIIDISTATFEQLIELPGIGAAEAHLLLKHRDSVKFIDSIDEMIELLNIKPHIATRIEKRVIFSKPPPLREEHVSRPTRRPIGGRTID